MRRSDEGLWVQDDGVTLHPKHSLPYVYSQTYMAALIRKKGPWQPKKGGRPRKHPNAVSQRLWRARGGAGGDGDARMLEFSSPAGCQVP